MSSPNPSLPSPPLWTEALDPLGFSRRPKAAFPYLFAFFFFLALVGSYRVAEVDPWVFFTAQGQQTLLSFLSGMFPPELSWEFLRLAVPAVVETVQISVMGTALAVLVGFPFGLVAAGTLMWAGPLHEAGFSSARRLGGFVLYVLARALLSVMRAIPELVWALMFVRAVGLGAFAGVLAIGVSYGGILGKVYSEILEAVDPAALEALQATGASRIQVFFYAVLPQAFPQLLSYTLYRWECALRAAAVMGFVGAGGIGQQVEISMRMFRFQEVLTLIGFLAVLVAALDALSARVRKKVL